MVLIKQFRLVLIKQFRATEHSAEMNVLSLQVGNSPKSLSVCLVREFKVRPVSRTAVSRSTVLK